MDAHTHILVASKFLEICGCERAAAIYSVLPTIDKTPKYYEGFYGHVLEKQPILLDSALEIFTGKRMDVAKGSYAYVGIKKEKESFLSLLGQTKHWIKIPASISNDRLAAALSLLTHTYIDSFYHPIQFFIPHSSSCSGQWGLWDKIDYLSFREKINDKQKIFDIRSKLLDLKAWKTKFRPDDFPLIVKRRLLKEKAFDKKLYPEAMIKAIIIRMGEIARPFINYEIIDYSIRNFFTYLGEKKYLRVDREIMFLRALEKEIKGILTKI